MPRARRLQFGLRLLVRTDARRRRCAAAAGERGQGAQRGARAAIMIDQIAEGARARYYGANAGTIGLVIARRCLPWRHAARQNPPPKPPTRWNNSTPSWAAKFSTTGLRPSGWPQPWFTSR